MAEISDPTPLLANAVDIRADETVTAVNDLQETVVFMQQPATRAGPAIRSDTYILNLFSLKDKVVVVTGGARGLGKEMMRVCAELGAATACVDLLLDNAMATCKEFEETFGHTSTAHCCDVADAESVEACFQEIINKHKRIDVLITAAGICNNIAALDYPASKATLMLNINILGTFLCCQAAARHMVKDKISGSIITIASMSAHIVNHPQPQAIYNASKAAVIQLTKSLAVEWAPHHIRVNSLSPGYMETELTREVFARAGPEGLLLRHTWETGTPMQRMGQPEELKGAIAYLASKASSFTTGADLIVDGGYTNM